jgi:hypothetical protein
MRALLVFTLLSGCALPGTRASTIGGGNSSPTTSRSTDAAAGTPEARGESKSYWSHADLQTLRGLSVEQATAKAKSQGFTGWIRTQVSSEFIEGCKPSTVCAVEDSHGSGGGTSADDGMMLYTNKTIEIPGPPSD